MKKALAILFSLLFVWMQVVASTPTPLTNGARAVCACCDCGKAGCCVAQSSSPDSAPAPAAPVRASFQTELALHATTSALWTLPDLEAQLYSPSAPSPLAVAGMPLFMRLCALLI